MYNEQEVRRGIALLDEKDPGWRESVDFEHLDIAHVFGCLLGQWRGNYYAGLDDLGLAPLFASEYGFNVHSAVYEDRAEYYLLTETWRTLAGSEPAPTLVPAPSTPSTPGEVSAPERELVFA